MTLHNYRHRGIGPEFCKEGRLIWYRVTDVDAWNQTRARRRKAVA